MTSSFDLAPLERLDPSEMRRVAATSAVYSPEQLKKKIVHLMRAFLFQHDCQVLQVAAALSHNPDALGPLLTINADRALIDDALIRILSIDDQFPKADSQTIDIALEHVLTKKPTPLPGFEGTISQLENLFNNSPDDRDLPTSW